MAFELMRGRDAGHGIGPVDGYGQKVLSSALTRSGPGARECDGVVDNRLASARISL